MKITKKVVHQIVFVICVISCLGYTTAMTRDLNSRLETLQAEYTKFVDSSKENTDIQVTRMEAMNDTLMGTSKNLEMILKNNELMQSLIMSNEIFNSVYNVDEKVEIQPKSTSKVERKPTSKPTTVQKKGQMDIPVDILNSVSKYSTKKDIDEKLVLAILYKESSFNPKAKNKIHYGLGQISEKTGKYIHEGILKRTTPYKPEMLYVVDINVEYTTTYLSYLFKLYKGDRYKVLKHYSGSKTPSVADRYIKDIDNLINKL